MSDLSSQIRRSAGSEAQITEALERVLNSKAFIGSNRMRNFLRYVVNRTLSDRISELKEYQLGLAVFERNSSYDPRIDPVVRVEARRLRFKLDEYYAGEGASEPIIINIPKGGYAAHFDFRVTTAVEPPAILIPLEDTAKVGIAEVKVPAQTAREAGFVAKLPHLYWQLAALALLAFLSGIAVMASHRSGLWSKIPPSVAVLPFEDLTGDPSKKYFSAGLTDEVTDELCHLKGLRVAAQTSAAQFAKDPRNLQQIGKALNVEAVLEGSVEQSEGRVKVMARLERISDGSRLWSGIYKRRADDLLDLQSDIAQGIAYGLKAAVDPKPAKQRRGHSQEAHDLYSKGRYEAQSMTPEAQVKSAREFQKAIDKDPNFGAAYDALGSTLLNRSTFLMQPPDRRRIEACWKKASELDPDLLSPREGLAIFSMTYDWDWSGAQRELQSALASGSSASVNIAEADYLLFHHRFAEADEYVAKAQELDPIGSSTIYNAATIRGFEGHFAEARAQFDILTAREPSLLAEILRDVFDIYDGRIERGLTDLRGVEKKFPAVKLFEAVGLSRLGRRRQALDLIQSIESNPKNGAPIYWFAVAYASLQDEANTLKWLNLSADSREWQALFLAVDPSFSWMQSRPGMQQLKSRMGLL